MKLTILCVVTSLAVAVPIAALGQAYPSKPLRLVLSFPLGSAADVVDRR